MNAKLSKRLISIAQTICPTNLEMRTSHVAFLLLKSKIVKIGWNKNKTSPKNIGHPYHEGRTGLHAEVDVMFKQMSEDLSKFKLVVIRIDRTGKICNSRPCSGCQSIIKNQFNVGEVWYSDQFGKIIRL